MIRGVHTMYYTSEPAELRAFLRDKLGFPATDVGGGWLIFDLPAADMGCHPSDTPDASPSGTHYVSFYCDDVVKTRAELAARGVEFARYDGMEQDELGAWSAPGGAQIAWFHDPDGNTLSLTQEAPPARS